MSILPAPHRQIHITPRSIIGLRIIICELLMFIELPCLFILSNSLSIYL